MRKKLKAKMTPAALLIMITYFGMLLKLKLVDEKSNTKIRDRIIDLVSNNM